MDLDFYHIDAFTNQVFGGNSAAICPLDKWLDDHVMQNIAMENAVAETAFFIPIINDSVNNNSLNNDFEIRWFTPEFEMDLCGHATLATAHVITRHLGYSSSVINFESKSGPLSVTIDERFIHLNFPSRKPILATPPQNLIDAFDIKPTEILKSRDYVFVFDNEQQIKTLKPNLSLFDQINLDPGGVVVTAPGNSVDFVSRFFTPQSSITEDPVTGSAHCSLIPYWAEKLNKQELTALQLSARLGTLHCKNEDERVIISGEAITYMIGTITI